MNKPKLQLTETGLSIDGVEAERVHLSGCDYYRAVVNDAPVFVRVIGVALFYEGRNDILERQYKLKTNPKFAYVEHAEEQVEFWEQQTGKKF